MPKSGIIMSSAKTYSAYRLVKKRSDSVSGIYSICIFDIDFFYGGLFSQGSIFLR